MKNESHNEKADRRAVDVLYRISSLAGTEPDPKLALEGILDEVMGTFEASSASISLLDAESDNLSIEVERGLSKESKGFELPKGVGITGWVALHGEPFLSQNIEEEERYFELDDRVRCEMAAPLTEGGRTVGALNVDSLETGAFEEEDLRLLVLIANEAGRVLENMWVIQQLRRKADQLQTLVLVGQDMTGARKVNEVLETITREALLLLECSLSAFFIYEEERDLLNLHCLHDSRGVRVYEESLKPAESILGTSLRGHRQVQTGDLLRTEEHHFVHLIRDENLQSMLVTPVLYEERPIGLLALYADRKRRFNDDERMIVRALADLGAIAVQNANLYARVFDSEESMRKSERLTTLGAMAAEIAHEIRNPLMVIRLLFDSLELEVVGDENKNKDLSVIREKLDHLNEIAGRILDFGKSRESLRKVLPLWEIVEDVAVLIRLKLEQSRVRLQVNHRSDGIKVSVEKGQLQQALLNLILNAVVAMPDGGLLEIETERVENDKARITIKDTGSGIPDEFRERIFDSFLSGREEGTGLGLAISKRILRGHDGDLELVESGSEGTVFRLTLPLSH